MNLVEQEPSETRSPLLLCAAFNQDFSGVSLGLRNGYRLMQLDEDNKPSPEKDKDDKSVMPPEAEYCIVERLFISSLVAFVTKDHRRKLFVYHFKKGTEICHYTYNDTILAVKLNRQRLVVVLKNQLYIHNIKDMKITHTIRDMPLNKAGLCTISNDPDRCFIAYPGSSQTGEVQVFDAMQLLSVTVIPAHNSPLAAVSFSCDGKRLATASEKGTVIRVFSIPEGDRLFEFRRGMKGVEIYSLAFDVGNQYLVSSSNTGTVHIFKLTAMSTETAPEEPTSWMGYVGKAIMSSTNYLPSQVYNSFILPPTLLQMTDAFTQNRGFAQVRLSPPGVRNTCALRASSDGKKLRLLVVTEGGHLLLYDIDVMSGGEYTSPIKEFELLSDHPGVSEGGLVGGAFQQHSPSVPRKIASERGESPSGSSP